MPRCGRETRHLAPAGRSVYEGGMITVIVPTLNAEEGLGATLSSLVPAAVVGLVREVIVADAGSSDQTIAIADAMGAQIIRSPAGRGVQLKHAAQQARFPWLLFLHADTVLDVGWEREASAFIERIDDGRREPAAAAFRFALDDIGMAPRILEGLVRARCLMLRLPYGDQGLLIPRSLYDAIGGYDAIPLMEDVALIRRLKRRQVIMMRSHAVTSAFRYRREGYLARTLRNQACLAMYFLRVPTRRIAAFYEGGTSQT
jgi:rSAM/selenodomain-associated transferase 2